MSKLFYIADSKIHGKGVFCREWLIPGNILFLAFSNRDGVLSITELGAKVNHSNNPNTEVFEKTKGEWYLYTLKPIFPGTELTANYSNTPIFIARPKTDWN